MVARKVIGGLVAGGALVLALGGGAFWASQVFAPGTQVAGVDVGMLSQGAATEKVEQALTTRTVAFSAEDVAGEVSGTVLFEGTSAAPAVETAFADSTLLGHLGGQDKNWTEGLKLDGQKLQTAVFDADTTHQTKPVDSTITYAEGAYQVGGGTPGRLASLAEVEQAFLKGQAEVQVPLVEQAPAFTLEAAKSTADKLNAVLPTAGFYVDEERLISVGADEVASWLTVTPEAESGSFTVAVNDGAVEARAAALPGEVNRDAVVGEAITNLAGEVIEEISPTSNGYKLASTDGLVQTVKDAIAGGSGVFALQAERQVATPKTYSRSIDVNLSTQTVTLTENGAPVASWLASTGKPGTPTAPGEFVIGWKTESQDMGCGGFADYCTPNVPWVAYFNGDDAFHGAYWHNNFGNVMSHGCVNLAVDNAKFLFDWAPEGTNVSVHS